MAIGRLWMRRQSQRSFADRQSTQRTDHARAWHRYARRAKTAPRCLATTLSRCPIADISSTRTCFTLVTWVSAIRTASSLVWSQQYVVLYAIVQLGTVEIWMLRELLLVCCSAAESCVRTRYYYYYYALGLFHKLTLSKGFSLFAVFRMPKYTVKAIHCKCSCILLQFGV